MKITESLICQGGGQRRLATFALEIRKTKINHFRFPLKLIWKCSCFAGFKSTKEGANQFALRHYSLGQNLDACHDNCFQRCFVSEGLTYTWSRSSRTKWGGPAAYSIWFRLWYQKRWKWLWKPVVVSKKEVLFITWMENSNEICQFVPIIFSPHLHSFLAEHWWLLTLNSRLRAVSISKWASDCEPRRRNHRLVKPHRSVHNRFQLYSKWKVLNCTFWARMQSIHM